MTDNAHFKTISCQECLSGAGLDFEFTMAFQPFVDADSGGIFGYEALVRGPQGESAPSILKQVTDANRYRFDQACRVKAIQLAAELELPGVLSINFLPGAIYRPETCIRATLEAAQELHFARERLMFEVTEGEKITNHAHLRGIFTEYKKQGFLTAIDDFGAGYAGLALLAEFQPDFIKLDMALTRNIDKDVVRQAIVSGILATCGALKLGVIAEGIEAKEEFLFLRDKGIRYYQGYLFARPGFRSLPDITPEGRAVLESAGR